MVTENSPGQSALAPRSSHIDASYQDDVEQVLTLYVPVHPVRESFFFRSVKRSVDVVIAILALIALAPVMVILAILIKMQDGGPVLYRQVRTGRYGVPFMFCKFRSMSADADEVRDKLLHKSDVDGAAFKMKKDPRVTPLGRFIRKYSFDELPQLFSVLAGNMTIVGPRPHLPEEVKHYTFEQRARLLVKPGLICIREVTGRSHLSFDEWIKLDLQYVNNRSILMETTIFLKAFPAVIRGEGAY